MKTKHITSRKHVPSTRRAGALSSAAGALAMLMLPLAAHAADEAAGATSGETDTPRQVHIVGERENVLKADRAASPKYTESLLDTPQTVIAIKKELFEQQGATTLTEALQNTPGVGTFFLGENGSTNTGDAIYMRGFDSAGSIFVDGIRDIGSISRDVFNIEQIDVLKGPAGTDTGRGAPTGSVNLSTRQPQLRNSNNAGLTGGAYRVRATADLNRVLNAERGVALRVNLLDQDNRNPARDEVRARRWGVAPSLAFGLNGATKLYVDYLHIKQDNLPDGTVPTVGLPGYTSPAATKPELGSAPPVDPKNFYGARSDFDRVKADMFTVILDHEFSPRMRLRNVSRYGKTTQLYLLSAFMGTAANIVTTPSAANPAVRTADPSTWLLNRGTRTVKDQQNDILANQSTLTGEFGTGALRHTLVAGLDLSNEKQVNYGRNGAGTLPLTNFYHPDTSLQAIGLNLVRNGARTQGETTTESGYLLDTIRLGEKWLFGVSARVDHFDTAYDALPAAGAATAPVHLELTDSLVSGKASLLYKPTDYASVYALWANSRQPPGSSLTLSAGANSASNPIFAPQVSINTEVGAKLELLNRRLGLNAALFRTVVKNEIEQDPVDLKYYQTGRKRVQGVELSAVGEITREWSLSAGYSWMDTSIEAGRLLAANGENALTYTPKAAFTGWTTYAFPFGLKIGGGVRYAGRLLRGTDGAVGTPAYTEDYWVADAMASYAVNRNVDLRLNVYNLGDKRYVASINKSGYRYTPGAPRWASVTANVRF